MDKYPDLGSFTIGRRVQCAFSSFESAFYPLWLYVVTLVKKSYIIAIRFVLFTQM